MFKQEIHLRKIFTNPFHFFHLLIRDIAVILNCANNKYNANKKGSQAMLASPFKLYKVHLF
ncbi:hypothetical protein CTI18_01235 [Prevotella intermedia]|uniref:Uncharacterized protein n=1 Tax=Prevotella intermedia TaxID=28131 RepID=A0A2G8I9A2_PREIN|nr:hypothetical protein CTI18_01235 [Prevotella intermedia]